VGGLRVESIAVQTGNEKARVLAKVTSLQWAEPRELWIDVPAEFGDADSLSAADPWLAALLLPAMRQGENLELTGSLSWELASALDLIQAVYAHWLPSARRIDVGWTDEPTGTARHGGVGLFFSCGVDSWYSLLSSEDRPVVGRASEISHLVNVHGVDIDVGTWKLDVAREVARNTRRIAEGSGLGVMNVATNLRQFYSSTSLSWRWGQAGALAAIALLLGDDFRRFLVAAGPTNSAVVTNGDREAGHCHPLLMPMFSTARCELVIDGGAIDRHSKVERVVRSPLALETLRVCWASHDPEYNCGRCAKCVRTMIELASVGALGSCPTLPAELDPATLLKIPTLFSHETFVLEDGYRRLAEGGAEPAVLAALREGIDRSRREYDARERALETIRRTIPEDEAFALFDEDELRYDVARSHVNARPFPERDGSFNGLPADGASAVDELRLTQRAGAVKLVVWKNLFWALDYYPALRDLLDAECDLVGSTPEVKIYALADAEATAGTEAVAAGTLTSSPM
jgi:hypothetical protein